MRQLVGLLRENEARADAPLEPQPGIADLERLIDDAERSGLAVELEIDGERRSLPPMLDLAACRILQEGLTNVRKHASAAHAHVSIRYERDRLDVVIRDNGRLSTGSGRGGHRLIGMRERVNLLGGRLEAGPAGDGGFVLHARLPLAATDR